MDVIVTNNKQLRDEENMNKNVHESDINYPTEQEEEKNSENIIKEINYDTYNSNEDFKESNKMDSLNNNLSNQENKTSIKDLNNKKSNNDNNLPFKDESEISSTNKEKTEENIDHKIEPDFSSIPTFNTSSGIGNLRL